MANKEYIIATLKDIYPNYEYSITDNKIEILDPPTNHNDGNCYVDIVNAEITDEYTDEGWIDWLTNWIIVRRYRISRFKYTYSYHNKQK